MGKNIPKVSTTFQFCDGGSCRKAKSEIAIREARAYLRNQGLWDSTHTIKTKCNGRCEDAPTWIVQPDNFWYKEVTPEKAVSIVKSHTQKNKPVEEYLLYKEGWTSLLTDKERIIPRPTFKHKIDTDYGEVLIAKAFASDQHLYPLFQVLFEEPRPIAVQQNDTIVEIRTPHKVDYADEYMVHIQGDEINFSLAIALVPKEVSDEIAHRKVSVAEVIWIKNNLKFTKALRFKNKKGAHLVTLWIKEEDTYTWEHILNIYLSMNPKQIRIETHEM